MSHSNEEVLAILQGAEMGVVSTAAGVKLRTRMMHFAVDTDFTVYLATMKGDPKTLQMTHHPSISILVLDNRGNINESREVEITGSAGFVTDPQEKKKALELTYRKSPVVKYLKDTGSDSILDYIRVTPEIIKYRIFGEIVGGMPPTVIDFPVNKSAAGDWPALRRKLGHWWMEVRPSFLTASLVPILLGTAVAWAATGQFHAGYFVLTLLAGLLLHAGTDVINDYFDHRSGNDEANRSFVRPFSGGSRLIQLGLMSPVEVLAEALLCFALGSAIGVYLAWARGPFILVLGLAAVLSGFFYTGKPFNWASRGLGEFIVALNFGPLMALGAYYTQVQALSWLPVLASLPVAFFIAAVLYINEFPDYEADRLVGKRNLVVRLGKQKAVAGCFILVAGAYVTLLAGLVAGNLPVATLLGLLTVPLAVKSLQYARAHYGHSFDMAPGNGFMVTGHLAMGLLLTLAFLWQGAGYRANGYLALAGAGCVAFVAYMWWYTERHRRIFHGLKTSLNSRAV
ncbi:MAG: 1,4-dihydroxy-2-naphthoate octaprenyltransferase [Chloroflexi bacterium]|nr:1,4-dihydroxy-2-naphthoate octaprenyltransferase [Chloroflexota bacterium]